MLFLVELDHVQSGNVPTPETGRTFIEQIILPTLARAEALVAEKRILSGGPVLGRVALRFIMEADSSEHVDRMITTLPVWRVAETRVTPLITFNERREHVTSLLEGLATSR
jgi:muconolactone delta-isomerase